MNRRLPSVVSVEPFLPIALPKNDRHPGMDRGHEFVCFGCDDRKARLRAARDIFGLALYKTKIVFQLVTVFESQSKDRPQASLLKGL